MSKNRLPSPLLAACGIALIVVQGLAQRGPAQTQKEEWPPISAEERSMKDCVFQPGAPAIYLLRDLATDDEKFTTTVFKRLKILTAAGRDRANIEIPFFSGSRKVTGIEARVVPPQGPPRDFKGQIFEKTAMSYRKARYAVKTFALPDVEVGSIIDYRYKLEPDYGKVSAKGIGDIATALGASAGRPEEGGVGAWSEFRALPAESWDIQDELFTKKAKFSYTANSYIVSFLFGRKYRMAWVGVGMRGALPNIGGERVELEVSDVPAFEPEEFMTPEESERMSVDLFFLRPDIDDNEEFWQRESKDWQKGVETFIGKPAKFTAEAAKIVGDATDPSEKLKRIYLKAQSLRNLSYEKGMTQKQRKEQKIKDNTKVAEVLERGYGLRSDITRTFAALARAAGFTADIVRVVSRDNKLFRKHYLSFYSQFDSEVAEVKVGEKTLLFDPATPFCPFGLVHWSRTNTAALRSSDIPPKFFTTPGSPPDLALTQRDIALSLDLQGNLAGTVRTTYTGHEALVRRLDHINDDAAAKREALEKEIADALPMGAKATLTKMENIDNNEPALIVHYDVSIPGIATVAGEKMLLPVSPFLGGGEYPFQHARRRYPVYFPYAFREFDDIVITLPEGLAAEVRPEPRKHATDAFLYSLVYTQDAPQKLHIQRDLTLRRIYYPVDQYPPLKSFYAMARTCDEEQIVLAAVKK
jgi:hypothetical protein